MNKSSDIRKYIDERKERDLQFAVGYEEGYRKFRVGMLSRKPERKIDGKFVEQVNIVSHRIEALRSLVKK